VPKQPGQKSNLPKPLLELLSEFGISESSIQKLRFGGIVGKVALVALGGLTATVTGIRFTTGLPQLGCLVVIPGVTLLVIRWILDYAHQHPWSATLEGAEALVWQHHQVMLAAMGVIPPSEAPQIASPFTPQQIAEPPANGPDKEA
jgi:hypothetical protein